MRFSSSVLLVSLAAMACVAPTTSAAPKLVAREGWCEDSTFINASSGGSPQIVDCQQLAANIVGSGNWFLTASDRTIAQYGTCAFNARVESSGIQITHIGNDDVRDIIRDSIAKFAWQGKVGSGGHMNCDGVGVTWGLFHA
ncbi:hypothetical protein ACEQ8H_001176 [Pleosporales sp. CAS-2024a]